MPSWIAWMAPDAILIGSVWLTYFGLLYSKSFPGDLPHYVSDDHLGIASYDGKWQTPTWKWHNVFKKFRYHFATTPNPNRNWKRDKQPPHVHSSAAHHRLNLWLFSGVTVLLYHWLLYFLPERMAFLATLLWIVHPLGCQTVGWISGIGYVGSTFFMLIGLHVVQLAPLIGWTDTPIGTLGAFLLFGFWQWMAVECQFATVGATLLLLLLHQWPYALIAGLISVYGCLNTLHEAVTLRKGVFQEQQMGQSTKFYPKKLIVVLKSLYYDFKLAVFPKRLGLYHTFCYHYELPYVEHEDWYMVGGLGVSVALGLGIAFGSLPIQIGCVWFFAFLVLFLNWITANQFVVDRYTWLPSFGVCLIAAALLPEWSLWLLIGIALMRTWAHLPTYDNEEKFYQSNLWNFPTSEVAYGNLGVTYLSRGWIGMAIESWVRGIQLNPEYDVSWYNLSSAFRSRGPINPNYLPLFFNMIPKELLDVALNKDPQRQHLHLSRYCLQKAVTAKTCHFPKPWQEELLMLERELSRPIGVPQPPVQYVAPLLTAALT